jgi:hypothetical protein
LAGSPAIFIASYAYPKRVDDPGRQSVSLLLLGAQYTSLSMKTFPVILTPWIPGIIPE